MATLEPPHSAPRSSALRYAMIISADRGTMLYGALAALMRHIATCRSRPVKPPHSYDRERDSRGSAQGGTAGRINLDVNGPPAHRGADQSRITRCARSQPYPFSPVALS